MATKLCMVKIESTAAWLVHPAFAVKLNLAGELQIAEWVNRLTGKTLCGGGSELRCQLDAAAHRIDLPGWRQSETGEASSHPDQDWGYTGRYFDPFCDDSSWFVAGSLVGYTHLIPTVFQSQRETEAAANRYQWARSHFILPEEASGQPITLTLGGYSLGDFDYMRVFLNGAPIGIREVAGLFRKPGVFAIDPATAAYKTLRFGQDNVLALQLKDFFSRPEELEQRDRYRSFTLHSGMWNVIFEQTVCVGGPTREARFHVVSHEVVSTGEQGQFAVILESGCGLVATVTYAWSVTEPVLSRRISIENRSDVKLPLLDIDLCEFETGSETASSGGVGFPAYVDEQFHVSSTHPASLNQYDHGHLHVRHFHGRELAAGERVELPETILGVAAAGDGRAAFRECVQRRARRLLRNHRRAYNVFLPMNDDETFFKDETRELSSLEACERLQADKVIQFDAFILGYFAIDAGGDFLQFDAQRWPKGGDDFLQRLRHTGMKLGMGLAGTSPISWSLGRNPALCDSMNTTYSAGTFCMAAPAYRTLVNRGMRDYVRQFGMEFFVIDQTVHRCHNPHHGHRIGNYSVTASFDACMDLFQRLDQENPDLFIQLYWGFASPWWLQWADTLFEPKGLLMEARNPTEQPTLFFRDSVTLGLDRAHEFASEVPRCGKDSLGIWLTKNLWNSDTGPDRWAEGLVMDLCRGNLLAQLWGHPDMLSPAEWRDAARLIGLLRDQPQCFAQPRLVLGDPWKDPLYGYCCTDGDRAFIALNNCSWSEAVAELELNPRWGLSGDGPWTVSRWWPHPARIESAAGDHRFASTMRYPLRPFEVVLLEVVREGADSANADSLPWLPWPAPAAEPAQPIPLRLDSLKVEAAVSGLPQRHHSLVQANGDYDLAWKDEPPMEIRQRVRLTGTIPSCKQAATMAVAVRMFTGNYAARLGTMMARLVSVTATLDGKEITLSPVVGRAETSWQVFEMRLDASPKARMLVAEIASAVDPQRVRCEYECHLLPGILKEGLK